MCQKSKDRMTCHSRCLTLYRVHKEAEEGLEKYRTKFCRRYHKSKCRPAITNPFFGFTIGRKICVLGWGDKANINSEVLCVVATCEGTKCFGVLDSVWSQLVVCPVSRADHRTLERDYSTLDCRGINLVEAPLYPRGATLVMSTRDVEERRVIENYRWEEAGVRSGWEYQFGGHGQWISERDLAYQVKQVLDAGGAENTTPAEEPQATEQHVATTTVSEEMADKPAEQTDPLAEHDGQSLRMENQPADKEESKAMPTANEEIKAVPTANDLIAKAARLAEEAAALKKEAARIKTEEAAKLTSEAARLKEEEAQLAEKATRFKQEADELMAEAHILDGASPFKRESPSTTPTRSTLAVPTATPSQKSPVPASTPRSTVTALPSTEVSSAASAAKRRWSAYLES